MPRFGLHAAIVCALFCAASCSKTSPSAATPPPAENSKPPAKPIVVDNKPAKTAAVNPAAVDSSANPGNENTKADKSSGGPDSAESVESILKVACDRCKNAKSIAVDVESSMDLKNEGRERRTTSNRKFSVERPNRFAFRNADGQSANEIVSDGKTLFVRLSGQKKFNQSNAPKSLEEFASGTGELDLGLEAGNIAAGIALSILGTDPYAGIMRGVKSTENLGIAELGGEQLRHVRLVHQDFLWDAWLTSGKTPAFRKIAVDLSKNLGGAAAGAGELQLTGAVVFRNWKFDVPVDKGEFEPAPPEGSQNTDKK